MKKIVPMYQYSLRAATNMPSHSPPLFVQTTHHRHNPSDTHPENHKLARTATPPNKAPTAMAPVFIGAALGLVAVAAVELALLVIELAREATELVRDPRAEVMEARSEPVAVANTEEKDESWLAASLLTELSSEEAAEVIEESTELECVETELRLEDSALLIGVLAPGRVLVVVTTVWALM